MIHEIIQVTVSSIHHTANKQLNQDGMLDFILLRNVAVSTAAALLDERTDDPLTLGYAEEALVQFCLDRAPVLSTHPVPINQ